MFNVKSCGKILENLKKIKNGYFKRWLKGSVFYINRLAWTRLDVTFTHIVQLFVYWILLLE